MCFSTVPFKFTYIRYYFALKKHGLFFANNSFSFHSWRKLGCMEQLELMLSHLRSRYSAQETHVRRPRSCQWRETVCGLESWDSGVSYDAMPTWVRTFLYFFVTPFSLQRDQNIAVRGQLENMCCLDQGLSRGGRVRREGIFSLTQEKMNVFDSLHVL